MLFRSAVVVLVYANHQPHQAFSAQEEALNTGPVEQLTPQQVAAKLPAADLKAFSTIVSDTLGLVDGGDQSGAATRITDLETAWDDAQARLEPIDEAAWTFLDGQIDVVLKSIRAASPVVADEKLALNALLTSLGG